jgi:hypothetical protein
MLTAPPDGHERDTQDPTTIRITETFPRADGVPSKNGKIHRLTARSANEALRSAVPYAVYTFCCSYSAWVTLWWRDGTGSWLCSRKWMRPLAARRPGAFTSDVSIATFPFGSLWDPRSWDHMQPDMICRDDRPGEPPSRFWWAANQLEVYLHAYSRRWLPRQLVEDAPGALADALFEASRHWPVSIHLNKALWGAAPAAVARDRATSVNPAVFDAAALVVTASWQQYAYPGVPGRGPDTKLAATRAHHVGKAMHAIRALTPNAGSYVTEADYFEPSWQQSCWGANCPRLREIKLKYDPASIFRVHHGVGSEASDPRA